MTQGERMRKIRKTLRLTLEQVGERVGVGKTAISNIERGNRSLTEQMAKSYCREFNVNKNYLINGVGEMFVKFDTDTMVLINRIMVGENEFHKNLFKAFALLNENELLALESIFDRFSSIVVMDETDNPFSDIPDDPDALERLYPPLSEDDEEVVEYKKRMAKERVKEKLKGKEHESETG